MPVEDPKDWKPGSYEKRHYGIKHKKPGTNRNVYHTGTDVNLPFGKPIRAIANGEIVKLEYSKKEYGRLIVIKHQLTDDPKDVIFSVYMHLSKKDGHRNRAIDTRMNRFIKRGEWLGNVGSDEENGDGKEHLHFGIYKGEAPKEGNGEYSHVFVGYGKLENEIHPDRKSHAEKIDANRTLERIGGNAIDPVAFLKSHMPVPETMPAPLHTFNVNKTADPKNRGGVLDTVRFQRPRNGRYILRIVGSAKNGKQNYPNKWRGDDDDGWWDINGEDPRTFINRLAHQGAYGFNGAESQGYAKELWILVDTKSDQRLSALNKVDQVLTLYADESLTIKKVEVYPWADADRVVLPFHEQAPLADVDVAGLPFKNFITAGRTPKKVLLTGRCMSAMCKLESDDDGIKVIKNHVVVKNDQFPNSRRYGGFCFSGDQDKGGVKTVELTGFSKKPWNVVELFADNTPFLEEVVIEF